jgi:serine phosphatase RsbU (regulator of sigma subunit)
VLQVQAPARELVYELAHSGEATARRTDRLSTALPHQALEQCMARRSELVYNLAIANGQAAEADWDSFGTFYCAPLIKQDRLLGVLYLENRQAPVHYTEERLAFLNALIQQLPAPLDNVLLYESLEEKVRERTRIIEEKNESITDSINYARRIQLAILPEAEQLSQLFPQHFIYYQPKDIVCGDFYWWTEVQDYFFVAAVDCTGHGVPGAFMSVLGYSFLNQLVREHRFLEPDAILNQLHRRVFTALKQGQHIKDQPELHDGMDLILCRFDRRRGEVQFAGANRPLWVLRQGKVSEYKTDRQPIGGSLHGDSPEDRHFTSQTLALQTGDRFYLFSDGLTDQFGGEDHRKFGSRRFQEILEELAHVPLPEHAARIEREHLTWRGSTSQTDDILCLGLEVG